MSIELPMAYGFILSGAILSHYLPQDVTFRENAVLQATLLRNLS